MNCLRKKPLLIAVCSFLLLTFKAYAEDSELIHLHLIRPCPNEGPILVHTVDCDRHQPHDDKHQPPDTLAPPTVTRDAQAAYDRAFDMLKQTRYEDSAEEFASFLSRYTNSQLTDDAWYWMGEALYVTGDYEQALTAFNTVLSYFTNSPRIPASRLKIGYIQYEISDYISARETLATLLQDFPAHRVAVSAEARLKKMAREGR